MIGKILSFFVVQKRKEINMKKKLFIVLGALFLSISLLFSYIVKDNKEENNKEISKVEKLLSKPEGIQAYTLNGEKTDKTFDEMVNYFVVDTITCQNGSVATYNQNDNTVTMTNVHVPEYCVMNFKPGTYTLTIDPNGGYRASDNDSSIMKVNYQYGHVESITERKKDGYTLIGYEMFNTDTGSADDVKGSKFEFDSSTNIGTFTQGAANITLKATWGTDTYKVTLDNQGATTAGTAEVYYQYNTTNTINGVTCYYYTDVTLKTCVTNGTTITVPTKAGYTFDGYYTEVNGGGTQYVNASGTFINNIYKTTGSKTLYAKWTANKYKLTLTKGTGIGTIYYKINGASAYTSATATTTLDVNYDSTYYYYGVALTGYTYTKCTESSPCSAKMGAEAASQTLTGTISKYKLTLTKGTGIGTIYYKINGASTYTSTTATATLNVNYGSTYYYYGVASTGYTYTACTASSPCSGKMGSSAVNKTLSANIISYKVTLTVSGGAGSTSKNINYNSSGTFTGVKPNSGYTATGATLTCNGGATIGLSGTTVTVSKVTKTQTCTVKFKSNIKLLDKLLADNPTRKTRTDFSKRFAADNTKTLYTSTETISGISSTKTVYYFAGNAKNNWVKFGGYLWRIIRTNHDSSIRLLYSGTVEQGVNNTDGVILYDMKFNYDNNSPKYVGYMYGSSDSSLDNIRGNTASSTIKSYIDSWYKATDLYGNFVGGDLRDYHLDSKFKLRFKLQNYENYLSKDAVYCADRNLASGYSYSRSGEFLFKIEDRIPDWYSLSDITPKPTYDCTNIKDAFSGNNTKALLKCADGSGICPVGLMTADEVTFAGGIGDYNFNEPFPWYMKNISSIYWLMTPARYDKPYGKNQAYAGTSTVGTDGGAGGSYVTNSGEVRPVTSLKACVLWKSGDGSASNPYEIVENGGC